MFRAARAAPYKTISLLCLFALSPKGQRNICTCLNTIQGAKSKQPKSLRVRPAGGLNLQESPPWCAEKLSFESQIPFFCLWPPDEKTELHMPNLVFRLPVFFICYFGAVRTSPYKNKSCLELLELLRIKQSRVWSRSSFAVSI